MSKISSVQRSDLIALCGVWFRKCNIFSWISHSYVQPFPWRKSAVLCIDDFRKRTRSQMLCALLNIAVGNFSLVLVKSIVRGLVSQMQSPELKASVILRRLVSQVSVDECRKWKKFNCLMLSWLSQVSTVQWQDSLQKSRVSCVEECQTESIVICVDDWPSANMRSVIV